MAVLELRTMRDIKLSKEGIAFTNPDQIINMGGPWIGELNIDGIKISDNVLIDNVYIDLNNERLYFVKYFPVSRWQKDNYFSVCYYDIKEERVCMNDLRFSQIFIASISNNLTLTYFDAFHDADSTKKKTIQLSKFG